MNLNRKPKYAPLGENLELDSLIEKEKSNEDYLNQGGHVSNLTHSRQSSHYETNTDELSLYKDDFISVYPSKVVIHNYYFPLGGNKTIRILDILSITTPDSMKVPWWDRMNWGRGYTNIWWAKDDSRGTENPNPTIIFSERGENSLKASSVLNLNKVMELIKERMMLC